MKNYLAFTKKEWLETWRTKRLLILLCIFLIFGIMNPLIAKITPELLSSTLGSQMAVTLPDPSSLDSWQQFYKNINQMGIYLVAILFSGCVVTEVRQGSFIQLVTKGLNRTVILISKLTVILSQWFLALFLCFAITAAYTAYYFPDKNSPHILTAFIPTLFFGIFLLSVVLLSSVLARSSYEALFITIGVQILLYFLQLFPKVQDYNPVELLGKNLDILAGKTDLASLKWNFLVSFILTLSALFLAVYQFNRKKL